LKVSANIKIAVQCFEHFGGGQMPPPGWQYCATYAMRYVTLSIRKPHTTFFWSRSTPFRLTRIQCALLDPIALLH